MVTLPCRQHTNGRNDAGKNWYRAKRTPIASYIFICVFGARRVSVYLCRPIESQNRVERKVTRTQGVVSFGCASRPSANARCAPPINLICYPKAGAWQIVLPACLPANPAIPPVIITSARTASERRWLHPPPSFRGRTRRKIYVGSGERNARITYVLSDLLHFFLNKPFQPVYPPLSI